jgi:hypothetical protein
VLAAGEGGADGAEAGRASDEWKSIMRIIQQPFAENVGIVCLAHNANSKRNTEQFADKN